MSESGIQIGEILVIDDDPGILQYTCEVCRNGGLKTEGASSGEVAMKLLDDWHPDIVVCDFLMPQLDKATFRRLFNTLADIPVVLVSFADQKGESLLRGANGFIQRPVDPLRCREEVDALVGKKPEESTVLIVEDCVDFTEIVKVMIKHFHNIITASNGVEALKILEHGPGIDVVITDIDMPEMDGIELIKNIRNDVNLRETPIIVQSAGFVCDQKETWIELGVENALTKNDFVPWLFRVLQNHLRIDTKY